MKLRLMSGELGHDMRWGRKQGEGYIGLFNERRLHRLLPGTPEIHTSDFIAALTYKEIAKAVGSGLLIGIAIPIARALFGI